MSPEGEARVQFDRRKKNVNLWVGHPVVCSNTQDIRFDLMDAGEGRFIIEANNVGDKNLAVEFKPAAGGPFLSFEPFKTQIAAGERKRFETELHLKEVKQ